MGILWNVTRQSEKNQIKKITEKHQAAIEADRQRMIKRTVRQR